MLILLIGPPGCGKGTQSNFIVKKFNSFSILNTGQLLRNIANQDCNSSISQALKQGKLLSDELVNTTVSEYLNKNLAQNYILDGFPRSINQAQYLDKNYQGDIIALLFDISIEKLEKRILGRFECNNCKMVYNKFYRPTKNANICDLCKKSDFYFREDDNSDSLNTRLNEYKNITFKLFDYYNEKKIAIYINCNESLEKISESIFIAISKFVQFKTAQS